jgi:uncharacterized RmlC-like cupin family protein
MKSIPLQIQVARAGELSPAPSSPGIERGKIFETDRALMIQARVAGNTASGWHHHGDRDVYAHLIQGRARFEFGPGGQENVEIGAGEFFYVPATLVHRDVNPSPEEQLVVLVFVGGGPLVVNVDGPE